MKIVIEEKENPNDEDMIIVRCNELSDSLLTWLQRLKTQEELIVATQGSAIVRIKPNEVYYFESVDNKTFLYTKESVYEIKQRLYEIEKEFKCFDFFRASKSIIVNLDKVHHLSPIIGSRMEVTLNNKEQIIISRQYVNRLKEKLGL